MAAGVPAGGTIKKWTAHGGQRLWDLPVTLKLYRLPHSEYGVESVQNADIVQFMKYV